MEQSNTDVVENGVIDIVGFDDATASPGAYIVCQSGRRQHGGGRGEWWQ